MDLQIGSTIGDYQVIGILGAGGMGKVYKVRNVISDRAEAMKVLLPDLANAPELADRFLREIKVQASMEHPNIAALHTAVRVENQLLMLMEFVDGVTLEQRLKDGVLPVRDAANYIMQVLSALDYAHQRGVVHRDIKPANMMLTPSGVVKLMDFGIAKASTDQKLTMTGTTMGSLYYMSPEQIQGAATVDGRSDLYSVGVSLYELVTGKRPFDGDSQFAIMSAHLQKNPVPPIEIDPRLPKALNDAILMSVARVPTDRFQTAAAFRNALGAIVPDAARMAAPAPVAAAAPAPVVAAAPAPVAAAAPARPVEPPPAAQPALPQKSHGRRGLWIAIGALTTAAVVIALIQYGPWKGSKAATATPATVVQTPAAPAPPTAEPVAPPSTPEQPAATPAPAAPSSVVPAASSKPVSRPAGARPAAASQPVQQPASAQPEVQPPVQAQQPPANPGPNPEELQAARDQYMMLHTRASGIRTSLRTLQQSQAAHGMNLRGDMQEAASLMDNFMVSANSALNAGDLASAKSYMEKAERQIEKLEKFLNR